MKNLNKALGETCSVATNKGYNSISAETFKTVSFSGWIPGTLSNM